MFKQTVELTPEMKVGSDIHITLNLPCEVEHETRPRVIKLTGRPGWKTAFDEAAESDLLTSIPRYLLRADKFPFVKGNYNGTGALWYRSDEYASGNFQWRNKQYNVVFTQTMEDFEEYLDETTGEVVEAGTRKVSLFSVEEVITEEVHV